MFQNLSGPRSFGFGRALSQKPMLCYTVPCVFYTCCLLFKRFVIVFCVRFQWFPLHVLKQYKIIQKQYKIIQRKNEQLFQTTFKKTLQKSMKTRFGACQDGPKSVIWSPGPVGSSLMLIWSSWTCLMNGIRFLGITFQSFKW